MQEETKISLKRSVAHLLAVGNSLSLAIEFTNKREKREITAESTARLRLGLLIKFLTNAILVLALIPVLVASVPISQLYF
jgi:uncharacterized membrane protein